MNKPLQGTEILIHCYKHDGSIHRCWSKGFVLEETDSHFIVVNNRTLVTESDGRKCSAIRNLKSIDSQTG